MSVNYAKLYSNSVLMLAKTLVIKSSESADSTNLLLTRAYGESAVNYAITDSWKYYLNLSGQYHSTDVIMTITSLDTLETINFTKENLIIHTATAVAYKYGTNYYNDLVARYPTQEQLIMGIIYPCDINIAINSPDGTILSYPKELVEPQEQTLILEIQEWIMRYLKRWHVTAFRFTDNLYNVAQHAIMYLNLVPLIFNLRLKRIKSNEVHSYHIRQHLASHSKLDNVIQFLTLKQQLFLYRNIRYIERNSGTQANLDWLIERILTERGIPIAEYSMRHQGINKENNFPEVMFYKHPINTETNSTNQSLFTIDEIFQDESPLNDDNYDYIQEHKGEITNSFITSASGVVQTKLMESYLIDYSNYTVYTFPEIALNHWAYMANAGLYTAAVTFKEPRTSNNITLTAKDAFIYMLFIQMKGMGFILNKVPENLCSRVTKPTKPSLNELKSITNKRLWDSGVAEWLIANQPSYYSCFTVDLFFKLVTSIFNVSQQQIALISNREHHENKAEVHAMVTRMYEDINIVFDVSNTDMGTWLVDKNLPNTDYSVDECNSLVSSILTAGIGLDANKDNTPASIQNALIGIIEKLSSYTIQIIKKTNSGDIIPINWGMIRPGEITAESNSEVKVLALSSDLQHLNTSISGSSFISDSYNYIATGFHINYTETNIRFNNSLLEANLSQDTLTEWCEHSPLNINGYKVTDGVLVSSLLGYEDLDNLTLDQKRKIPDIWTTQNMLFKDVPNPLN